MWTRKRRNEREGIGKKIEKRKGKRKRKKEMREGYYRYFTLLSM
jgi:hypothetical protein